MALYLFTESSLQGAGKPIIAIPDQADPLFLLQE
jgi:hypothetical protein